MANAFESTQTTARGQYRFRFNGGHTVNVFQYGAIIDVFSVGDFAKNAATLHEVHNGIRRWIGAMLNDGEA